MSSTNASPAENGRAASRSPTYAEALKAAPRPAPINTAVARAGTESGSNTAGTASSGLGSVGSGSFGSALTAATSLSSLITGSPGSLNVTQSATISKKLSWEQSLAKSPFGHLNAVATPLFPPQSSPATSQRLAGLGLELGNTNAKASGANTSYNTSPNVTSTPAARSVSPTSYQYSQRNITEAQTSPYVNQAANSNANTDPVPQYPFGSARQFANQHRILPPALRSPQEGSPYSVPIGAERKAALAQAYNTAHNDDFSTPDDKIAAAIHDERPDSAVGVHESADSDSVYSTITKRETAALNDALAAETEVIQQEPHSRGFTKHLRFKKMPENLEGAFDKAYITLKTVNGVLYELPPLTRVICVKTDYVTNVQWSIQRNTWAAMDRVGERIMRCWNERTSKDEKVLLLFSVNGQKSYCGLAEMIGPYQLGGDLEHWQGNDDGSTQWGTIPVTWKYVKNVSYGWFGDIRHSHNDSLITNMWNGMHFPLEPGRTVVKRYIDRPHFTNILCWEKGRPYHPLKNVQPWQIDPTMHNDGPRGKKKQRRENDRQSQLMIEDGKASEGRRDMSMATRGGGSISMSRNPSLKIDTNVSQYQEGHQTNDTADPMSAPTPYRLNTPQPQINVTPTNFDDLPSPSPRPGQMITAFVDEHGNIVPLTPHGHRYQSLSFQSPTGNTPSINRYVQGAGRQPSFHNSGRGRGAYTPRGARGGSWRGAFSPAPASRSFTAYTNHPVPHTASAMETPTTVRMRSDRGVLDTLQTPHRLRNAKSMSTVMQSDVTNASVHPDPLQRSVGTANFVPQQKVDHPGIASSFTHTANTATTVGMSTSTTPSFAEIRRAFPPSVAPGDSISNVNVPTAALGKPELPSVNESDAMPSGEECTVPKPTSGDEGVTDTVETALTFEEKKQRYIDAVRRSLKFESHLARMNLEADPSFPGFGDPDKQDPADSEQGGLACFVSTSSIEKRKISPPPSLHESDWNSSQVNRLKENVEGILASPEASEEGATSEEASSGFEESKTGGGVDL